MSFSQPSLCHQTSICPMQTVHLTPHFSVIASTFNDLSHDIGSSVCARHPIHVSCACVFDLSSDLSSHSSFVSPIFHFMLLNTKPSYFMTWRTVTTPSAERSLHHRSLRSEKNQRAVDKLTTLLKKVCCQVSRCLSVM